ncbi:MAG: hypothetical protein H0X51_03140 [Parachlamydiaceae bacterium]|nr:hypothetical protein [Parachlamydiaceae bacterium]
MRTGLEGSPAGSQILNPEELSKTAATQVVHMQLGIMTQDQYDMLSVADMNRHTTWKYQGDATKPALFYHRIAAPAKAYADRNEASLTEYKALLEYLPEDIKLRYIEESKLPLAQRSEEYGQLDALLGLVADFMVWAKAGSQRTGELSPTSATNLSLSGVMLQNVLMMGKGMTASIRNALDNMGHNDPNFDILSLYASRLSASLELLESSKGQDLASLVKDLQSWSGQLQNLNMGSELQAIRGLMEITALIAAATVLETGAAPLLIGIGIASIGISTADGQMGILSPGLAALAKAFADGLSSTLMPLGNASSAVFMPMLAAMLFISTISATTIGLSESNPLLFDLVVQFAVSTGLLTGLGNALAKAGGADESTSAAASNAFSLVTALTMLQTIYHTDKKKALETAEVIKSLLSGWLDNLEEIAASILQDLNSSSPLAHSLSTWIQEAKLALNDDNWDHFLAVCERPYVKISNAEAEAQHNEDKEHLKDSIQALKEFIAILQRHGIKTKEEDLLHPNIGIFQG